MNSEWKDKIWDTTEQDFEQKSLQLFRFQYDNNLVYRQFAEALGRTPDSVVTVTDIPFLPIRFFKSHTIQTTSFQAERIFESSGTTGMETSRHYVKDLSVYKESFTRGFEYKYGNAADWCIVGLLPSYLERENSSLVYMVDELIRRSGNSHNGFYLHNYEALHKLLRKLEVSQQKTLLIGVTFALLDFAEQFPMSLTQTIVMETGGMKGRRKEIIRDEIHAVLQEAFHCNEIHSEYGMTELLSQAYSEGRGIFRSPSWMKILVRDEEDPLLVNTSGRGALNIIDLANIYSCAFIATDDAGTVATDGSFRIAGRIDNSDLRGCSLLAL